jgi:hypothetical protein
MIKKNPQDTTLRNTRAVDRKIQKAIAPLLKRISKLEKILLK